jgi:hypothetical protein
MFLFREGFHSNRLPYQLYSRQAAPSKFIPTAALEIESVRFDRGYKFRLENLVAAVCSNRLRTLVCDTAAGQNFLRKED